MNPLVYGLCQQTVTVYRKQGENITRKVVDTCYFSQTMGTPMEHYGKSMEKKFLLIIPGNDTPLQPGNRVFAGVGPVEVDWQSFLPTTTPELFTVAFAQPCYWENSVSHWEAGSERRL